MKNKRIYLSPPIIDSSEKKNVLEAIESGWLSPIGSFIDEFTLSLSNYYNSNVLLTNSGTSSIFLSLKLTDIKQGDYVLCSDFTFAASAFPIIHCGGIPVFVGSEEETWNISPEYLQESIDYLKKKNIKPKALVLVHIYGFPAQVEKIRKICEENSIILIEDIAEAIGSTFKGINLGCFGKYSALSFNGNKLVTCSGGGALISNNLKDIEYARKIASQAKENVDYYLHKEVGYNLLLSNVLSSIGLAQFNKLNDKILKRRKIFERYLDYFKNKFDISYQKENDNTFTNRWLSTFIFNDKDINKKIKEILDQNNIESRYLWNPLHLNPVFKDYMFFGSEDFSKFIFERGLCLPSAENISEEDFDYIFGLINKIKN